MENNKNIIYIAVIVILVIINAAFTSYAYNKSRELDTYKHYYYASEKLFDEIEEDNEAYFDGDTGSDYLDVRKEIKDMNK